MPLIVDKEKERLKILEAFEKCLEEKTMDNITLRDIASKANMTHPKLLNYFKNKEDLVLNYCMYAKEYMSSHCKDWFESHDIKDFNSPLDCMNAFMEYVASGGTSENRPKATLQTYVLAKYNGKIQEMVTSEFTSWRKLMYECLKKIYKDEINKKQAEAMMILITGTFVCNYTNALTGNINNEILTCFKPLLKD